MATSPTPSRFKSPLILVIVPEMIFTGATNLFDVAAVKVFDYAATKLLLIPSRSLLTTKVLNSVPFTICCPLVT